VVTEFYLFVLFGLWGFCLGWLLSAICREAHK
jgi:hypothetical protein